MFDISWGKLVIIGVVALLVIGPKELPAVLRQLGQWMGKIRRMAAEFQGQFQDAMREAEMADLKQQFDETTSGLKSAFDTTDIKNELEKMIQDPTGTTSTAPAAPTATEAGAPATRRLGRRAGRSGGPRDRTRRAGALGRHHGADARIAAAAEDRGLPRRRDRAGCARIPRIARTCRAGARRIGFARTARRA